ncbi:MAG: arginine--tRNA ligase [candidate division Zixibacteria bacterium 4484_93]|nr:MAG: arginine--tRNA ligase [candidate division Zixibacteria bacterium 4484_93]
MGIEDVVREAIRSSFGIDYKEAIPLSRPKKPEFGDMSTSVAFQLAKRLGSSPNVISEKIAKELASTSELFERVTTQGGYINFHFGKTFFSKLIGDIISGKLASLVRRLSDGEFVQIEYVSANPTGPLNVVSARAAAVGSSLVNILRRVGYDVKGEYYLNDAGNQVRLLTESLRARIKQLKGERADIPDEGYHGEYLLDYARDAIEENVPDDRLSDWILSRITDDIKETLKRFGVCFDSWVSERELRSSGRVEKLISELDKKHLVYEKDGAIWFAATSLDPESEQDYVLVKSDGEYSYFAVDIAYHLDKFQRGFSHVWDIWGPDHHGHIKRMQLALRSLGYDRAFSAILLQQVNIVEEGKRRKMSKRRGELVTLNELLGEIDTDVARFFFLDRRVGAHLDFDLELARKESEENPVYYVKYAHARIRSIERLAGLRGITPGSIENLLGIPEFLHLARRVAEYPDVIVRTARELETHILTDYLLALSRDFHHFYHIHRVITGDRERSSGMLSLVLAVAEVIKDGLALLGIEAPERM